MANYYVIRIKFHWGFPYVTHYMKHSFLGTKRVISSIITRNFFATRNKQPLTIGTNRMSISFPEAAIFLVSDGDRDLWPGLNSGSPQFTDFPSLCACLESSLTNLIGSQGLNRLCLQSHSKPECRWTWPGVPIFPTHVKRDPVMGNIEPFLRITKPVEWLNKPWQGILNGRKSFAAEGFNVKIPFISQTYTKAVAISFQQSHTGTRKSCLISPKGRFY